MKKKIIYLLSGLFILAVTLASPKVNRSEGQNISIKNISMMASAVGEAGAKDKKQMQGSQGTFCCCPGSWTCGSADCASGVCD